MRKLLLSAALLLLAAPKAPALDLKELLSKAGQGLGSVNTEQVTSLIDDLFSSSNFDISKLEGIWKVEGSAVSFDSSDALSQIGGKAATATIQSKLDPYYEKFGLTGAQITFDAEGNFTLQLKKTTLKGKVAKTGDAIYETSFMIGSRELSPMQTWFEKGATGNSLDVLWDASRAISFMQGIASVVKVQSLTTLSSLLSNYDSLHVGFKLTRVQ